MRSITRVGGLAAALALGLHFAGGGLPQAVFAAPDNMVVDWNQTMLAAFANAGVPPPAANRLGGIVQAAVFDAVNGIKKRYTPIHVQPAAPDEASPKAAVASAAHEALVTLFAAQKPSLDAAFAASLQTIGDDEDAQAVADGIAWGKTVADQTLAWRAGDGFSATPPPYVFTTAPGQWQPTPGGSGPPKFRTLATTTPFALTSPSQFRPAGPPALTSARYAQDFNEVKMLGGLKSMTRTAYQTETAEFWQFDLGIAQWDRVADTLLVQSHKNLLQTAHILALTDIAITDTVIALWDAKNAFNSWRPVTAIVNADLDGNPDTTADPTWLPLLVTPYFQEYPSGHAGTSSAAAAVLASFFGDSTSFTMTSLGLPVVVRSFTSFHGAVEQVSDARVLAGFHFRFACDDANAMGVQIAAYVRSHLMLRTDD